MSASEVFKQFVPNASVEYVNHWYETLRFTLKITRSRKSKLGDYRFNTIQKNHKITINHDLNPFAFLITYLHEVAHLIVQKKYKKKIAPHGKEWKNCFKEIAQPMLKKEVFPQEILDALSIYFKNPKASSCACPELYTALKKHDPDAHYDTLKDLPVGKSFVFRNRLYQKVKKNRTRARCKCVKTGNMYLISELASITKL